MKKAVFAISVICYLVVSSGVVVNFHYCMKRLDSVSFFQTASDSCGRCGMDIHEWKGCCHDEVKLVKLQQDQNKATSFYYDFSTQNPVILFASGFLQAKVPDIETIRHFHNHSPPLLSLQDTYLRNNVFRI